MSTDGSRVEQQLALLGVAVETFVPEDTFTRYLGRTHLPGLLAGLVVATLFSGDSLGRLPWLQALLAKGLGTGADGARDGSLLVLYTLTARGRALLDALRAAARWWGKAGGSPAPSGRQVRPASCDTSTDGPAAKTLAKARRVSHGAHAIAVTAASPVRATRCHAQP